MNVISIPFNHFLVNTYLLISDNNEAALVDPACATEFEQEKLKAIISDNKLTIKYILFTHTHIDHIAGAEFAKKTFPFAQFMMHADAQSLYNHADNFCLVMGFDKQILPSIDEFLLDNQILTIGNETIEVLFTPGHANGSICLYNAKDGFLLSGDVLFNQSIGRTDLPGGSYETLMQSIQTKILVLPPQTKIFPGHGDATSIEFEINNNPFL